MSNSDYCKERYRWYKARGICVDCGANWAEPGRVLCRPCAMRRAALYSRTDPGNVRKRENVRRLRDERRAAGLCYECGGPLDGPYTRCGKCLGKIRERSKMYRIRQRIRREADNAADRH